MASYNKMVVLLIAIRSTPRHSIGVHRGEEELHVGTLSSSLRNFLPLGTIQICGKRNETLSTNSSST